MTIKTIIIPCFNEINTIKTVIDRVKKNIKNEDNIIIVDDCSTDGTKQYLQTLNEKNILVKFHDKNFGKGQAIQTALKSDLKDIIIIQDADLEYNPSDYIFLINSIILKQRD